MTDPVAPEEVAELAADLRTWLEVQRSLGALHPTAPLPRIEPVAAAPATERAPRPVASAPATSPPAPPVAAAPATVTLGAVRAELGDCRRCRLCETRNTIVFGVGSEDADVVFVGEGPGYHEDQQGEPFVGAAGELLTRIITNVLRMERDDVYICNVVKCRPPGNRNPEPDEVAACSPFLRGQLAAIRPKVVVALGRFAIQTLLGTTQSVGRLRGTAHPFEGAVLVPTYHPAYLLRNPADKRKTMQDMMLVRAEVERATGRALPPVLRRQR